MGRPSSYRIQTPDWLYVAIDRVSESGDVRLLVEVRTMDTDVLLVDTPLRASMRSEGAVDNDARELLQQVVERATVQLATMELEKD